MRIVAVVQARMGSTRYPGKVMQDLGGMTVIECLLNRLAGSKTITKIIVATSTLPENDILQAHVEALGFACYRGDEDDVLARFADVARFSGADYIVRITGDCPLIDPGIVDTIVAKAIAAEADYYSNVNPPTFPDGLDVEVLSRSALLLADGNAVSSFDREHVTPFIRSQESLRQFNHLNDTDYSEFRWTLDEAQDMEVLRNIAQKVNDLVHLSFADIIQLNIQFPELFASNKHFLRNEGSRHYDEKK